MHSLLPVIIGIGHSLIAVGQLIVLWLIVHHIPIGIIIKDIYYRKISFGKRAVFGNDKFITALMRKRERERGTDNYNK